MPACGVVIFRANALQEQGLTVAQNNLQVVLNIGFLLRFFWGFQNPLSNLPMELRQREENQLSNSVCVCVSMEKSMHRVKRRE